MRSSRARLALWLFLVCVPGLAWACTGPVVGVTDGDTLRVRCDGIETKIRLDQIDAPEKNQAYGTKAKQALSDLVFGKTVRVETHGQDRYGRTIGTVYVGDIDANREMVALGFAWAYRDYLRDRSLLDDEARARTARRGLWVDSNPIAPWDFRKKPKS